MGSWEDGTNTALEASLAFFRLRRIDQESHRLLGLSVRGGGWDKQLGSLEQQPLVRRVQSPLQNSTVASHNLELPSAQSLW